MNKESPKNLAPSLVGRCKDKYQNVLHKNYLKKRSGHEYDPQQSAMTGVS